MNRRTFPDSDPATFPQPVPPPRGAPNIVLVLIDDAGFGQFSTFGGGVPSPTMDRLAAEGLRFNTFHTTALCSPTRAALITGRNHQSCATGSIGEAATGYDGYATVLPRAVREGKLTFVYNYLCVDRFTLAAPAPLPTGRLQVRLDFDYRGAAGEIGKAATVALSVNGARVAEGQLQRTIPVQISLGEGMDIGMDVGSAVDFTYRLPFAFTGRIDKVTIELR